MKVNINVIPPVPVAPVKEVVITLTEREAAVVKSVCDWYGQVATAVMKARTGMNGGLDAAEIEKVLSGLFYALPHPEIKVIGL